MQIQFLDHLIMGAPAEGRAGYFSFKEPASFKTVLDVTYMPEVMLQFLSALIHPAYRLAVSPIHDFD